MRGVLRWRQKARSVHKYSLSNSAATLWHPCAHYDWVRLAYFVRRVAVRTVADIADTGLKPAVMTLSSETIGVQTLSG